MICVYRPPPSKKNRLTPSLFYSEFSDLLDFINLKTNVMLIGDFNVHFDERDHTVTRKITDLLDVHDLVQLVTVPTHQHGHTLDALVVRASDSLVCDVSVQDKLVSDHFFVSCKLKLAPVKQEKRQLSSRNIRGIDRCLLKDDVVSAFSDFPHCDDADFMTDCYNTTMKDILDRHAPLVTRSVNARPRAPWHNPSLRTAKQERRRAERKWRSTGLEVHRQIYQQNKIKVRKMVHELKTDYINSKIDNSSSSKELFKISSDLLGRSGHSSLPDLPKHEISDAFAGFFETKISNLREKIDNLDCSSDPDPLSHDINFQGQPLLKFDMVTEKEVREMILKCPPKSSEVDPIPTSLLKELIDVIVPVVTKIFNVSLSTGTVPSAFRHAIVKPLLKKAGLDINELKNFRPVSNLPFLSKILEKLVLVRLNRHLHHNNVIEPFQSGYRENHSTETALLKVVNDLLCSSDEGKVSMLALLDLSAAFDTIDHNILLERLHYTFGVADVALQWLKSYLTDRSQSVVSAGNTSQSHSLVYGVPQGSVLGPVLFTLYTQPMACVIRVYDMNYHFYADDSEMNASCAPEHLNDLAEKMSCCMSDVKDWTIQNKLKLNEDKTEAMVLGKPSVLADVKIDSLSVAGCQVPLSSQVKSLGVTFDSGLSMKTHINNVCKGCYFQIRQISKMKKLLSRESITTLVSCFVLSRLDYCNALLGGLPSDSLEKLQRVQNCAARMIFGMRKREHITPALKSLHWLPVKQRIEYKTSLLCFKHFHSQTPPYISELLLPYTTSRTLRSTNDRTRLNNPRFKLKNYGQRAFSRFAPSVWNKLPSALRESKTVSAFKSGLKTHLFNTY